MGGLRIFPFFLASLPPPHLFLLRRLKRSSTIIPGLHVTSRPMLVVINKGFLISRDATPLSFRSLRIGCKLPIEMNSSN